MIVRAYALWEGWFGYDRKKYTRCYTKRFQPFESCIVKPTPDIIPAHVSREGLRDTPLS